MSRSRYWLIAFAEPAASVPQTSVQNASRNHSAGAMPGMLAGREDHRRDRRDQQQLDDPGLRQRDVGADGVAGRSSIGAPASSLVARRVVAGPAAARREPGRAR